MFSKSTVLSVKERKGKVWNGEARLPTLEGDWLNFLSVTLRSGQNRNKTKLPKTKTNFSSPQLLPQSPRMASVIAHASEI